MKSLGMLLVFALIGCGREKPKPTPQRYDLPPYLGLLFPEALPYWQADCPRPLVETRTCGRRPWTPGCDRQARSVSGELRGDYTRATHVVQCPAPGWSIWTDDHHRIVAMCADDMRNESMELVGFGSFVAFDLILKHVRDPWLGEYILKGSTFDKNALGSGWVRWREYREHLYPDDSIYSDTYCVEVALPPMDSVIPK